MKKLKLRFVPYRTIYLYSIGRSADPERHSFTKSSGCFLFRCFSFRWFLSALQLLPVPYFPRIYLDSIFKYQKSPVHTGTVHIVADEYFIV